MAIEDIKNFRQVDARLGTAGQPTESQFREIASAGYQVVINLGLLDPKYCLPDEAGLVSGLGMEYHHIPVVFGSPQHADFERFVEVMDSCRERKTFVHCALNWRVSVFVALYGEMRLGWSRIAADSQMTTFWKPDGIWTAFAAQCRAELSCAGARTGPAIIGRESRGDFAEMSVEIRVFRAEDHAQACSLWQSMDGVGLSGADSLENVVRFLERNPGLSFVAAYGQVVVATILCGHDGRRGLIHHLAVAPAYRRHGLGRNLVTRSLAALRHEGIEKCHLLVFRENTSGHAFWRRIGAEERVALTIFSLLTSADAR